jgi:acetyltransferase-like isoleucine patch superfamily enzyme
MDRNREHFNRRKDLTREDPFAWCSRAARKLRTLWVAWTYPFASFGKGVGVHFRCRMSRAAARYIQIGDDVILSRGVRINACPNPGADPPALILEKGVGVQRRCVISVRNRVHIMQHVIMGPAAVVMDHSEELVDSTNSSGRLKHGGRGTILIEEGCWIGSRAKIVCEHDELVIGRNSVIGANCLVTHSIPSYSVVMGNPSSIVRQYDISKGKWVVGSIRSANGQAAHPKTRAYS